MSGVLQIGFYNYVTIESVIALIDYKLIGAKKIIKSARDEKPRSVLDITKGRKASTLIVLTGDRYIISAIPRQTLAKRLSPLDPPKPEEIIPPIKSSKERFMTDTLLGKDGETTRSKRKATETQSPN